MNITPSATPVWSLNAIIISGIFIINNKNIAILVDSFRLYAVTIV